MNISKSKVMSAVLAIVVLAVLAGIFLQKSKNADTYPPAGMNNPAPAYSGDTVNLVSVSLAPGQTVSGVLTVTGTLKGAYFFEANAIGQVLDANKNILKSFPLSATTDWMTADPVSFSGTVTLSGIASGAGYIRLHNDNPSGEPAYDRYVDIPVIFQ